MLEASFMATYFLLLTSVCAGFWILFLDKMRVFSNKRQRRASIDATMPPNRPEKAADALFQQGS